MYLYIDNTFRRYIRNSIKINDELQEKTNTSSFRLDGSFAVSYYEDVKMYQGAKIVSLSGTALVVDREYSNDTFRAGSEIWLGLGLSTSEKVTISAIDGTSITLTAAADNSHSADERMGMLMFAGNITDIKDANIGTLNNIELQISCIDYTRLFDKALINESYEDKDARYIVNDFCNEFINKNEEIDDFTYDDTTDLKTEWSDGNVYGTTDLVLDTSDYMEGSSSMEIQNSVGGVLTDVKRFFSPTIDLSKWSGNTTGSAVKGTVSFWAKKDSNNDVTDFYQFYFYSGSDNFYYDFTSQMIDDEWVYVTIDLTNSENSSSSFDWTAVSRISFNLRVVSESIFIDGIRVMEKEFFNHYPYVETSSSFSNFTVANVKPIEVMQRLADELSWFWYIDYERNIRLFKQETNEAPFNLTETSDNFNGLKISWDTSKLINKQIVKGGNQTSVSTYSEVRQGDGIIREWLTKNKFKNLIVKVDDNSSTDTMEGGTTTTNVTATAHGLITGDYIVNRTRSNAVRQITYVDDDNFTVAAVTSQTSGDTFSKFIEKDVGVEGINLDTGNDYMSNFNEKSIRNAIDEPTLNSGDFILFVYNEVVPILVEAKDDTSINNMISILGYTDGVFDGAPIVDRTINTRSEAIALANVYINKYSNVIIKGSFQTTFEGLVSGQLIRITDTNKRDIDQDFIIQKIILREFEDGENIYNVTCSTSLFGIIEFFQQLLKQGRKLEVSEDETVEKIITVNETVTVNDSVNAYADDENVGESVTVSDVANTTIFTPPYKWGVDADDGDWNLFEWS